MKIAEMIKDGINDLLDSLSNESGVAPFFVWQSVNIPCLPSMIDSGATIVIGGLEATLSCTLHVRVKEFLTADSTLVTVDSEQFTVDAGVTTPVVGKLISFRQKNLRIIGSSVDSSNTYLKLLLGSPNQ